MDRDALAAMPEAAPQETVQEKGRRRSAFRALHSRPFRIYFAGQVVSASGTFLQQTAIGWLVLKLTGSASSLGLVLASGGIPFLLFGPWGGTVADRLDLRKLLIATQSTYGVLAAVLWGVAAAGTASVALIVTINVLSGFVQVSLNGVVVNSARVVGPALAGVLIVTVGTTPCFAVNAISYLAVVVALVVIHPISTGGRAAKHTGGVRAGLRYAAGRQQLWLPLLMMAFVGLLAFNFAVILPVLARDTFHGTGGTYGLLTTMLSVGSVCGSLAVGMVHHPRRPYLLVASIAFGACLAATAAAPTVVLASIALVVTGAAAFSFVTLASTALQLHSSAAFRGRIMALWVFVYIGTTPVGTIITGWVTAAGGPRAALLVGSAACIVAAVPAAFVRTPPHPDAGLIDLV
jgi:Transmembrane secretion effector